MTDRTVREGGKGATEGRTVREASSAGNTVREQTGGRTLREEGELTIPESRSAGDWLPAALASRFDVVEALPARGGEADLLVVESDDGSRFVAKIYRRGIKPKEEILRILKQARFEHVVRLEEFGEDNGRYWELMEYIEHSSLMELIDQEGPRIPLSTVRQILHELNEALTHLHELPIEHRDLKPDNVLVRTREPIDLVLADFGIASLMDASVRETKPHKTLAYCPPEALGVYTVEDDDGKSYHNVAVFKTRWDYWSLGMILVRMLTGKHPMGATDPEIVKNLIYMNVDDLVLGIEQEGWRKLCRGLLRRHPRNRWGSEQVGRWLANERDNRLVVEDEVVQADQNVRGIDFDGRVFTTPDSLGLALSQDWTKATSLLERRQTEVETWLFDKLGQQDLGQALQEVDKDARLSLDARTFFKIYLLAPSAPLRFRDMDLSSANVEEITRRAVSGDRQAGVSLQAIHVSGILPRCVKLEQGKQLANIERNWHTAVNDYRKILEVVASNGASAPALEGDTLVQLLAAALPVSSVVSDLRSVAQRSVTSDALQCSWFRDLGNPNTASTGSLIIIPHVVRTAEGVAKKSRYDSAIRNYGLPARFALGMAIGFLASFVLLIPGYIVLLPIGWIWGEEVVNIIIATVMIGAMLIGAFLYRPDLERIVGSSSQDHATVRTKGILWLSLTAVALLGLLTQAYGLLVTASVLQLAALYWFTMRPRNR